MGLVGTASRARLMVGAVSVTAACLLLSSCGPAPAPTAEYQFESFSGQGPLACREANSAPLRTANPNDPSGLYFARELVDGVSDGVTVFIKGEGLLWGPTSADVGNGLSYTLVMLFRLREVSGFRRLVDFKAGGSDNGLYVNGGKLQFYGGSGLGGSTVAHDEWAQVMLTRDVSSGQPIVRGYLDGIEQWSFIDSSSHAQISNELRFFKDNATGGSTGEESGGALARLRVFDRPVGPSIGEPQTPSEACST